MEFSRLIEARRSTRAFSDRPVEADKVARLVEAARWSPSCANRQPWRFVFVEKDSPTRAAVEDALDAGNGWARRAPLLVVSGGFEGDRLPVESRDYLLHDAGLALMSLVYRAVDLGLVAHPMAGWKEAPLRAALSLPDAFHPIAVTAVGYPGNPADLDEAVRKRDEKPRTRRPAGESAFSGSWGVPLDAPPPAPPERYFETDIPIRFADIDAMGHVNNALTLTLLEQGRMAFYAEVVGVSRIEQIDYVVAESTCRYKASIFLHDKVRMRMHLTGFSRSSFRFVYRLFDPDDGRVFTEAETVAVGYDYAAGRVAPISPHFIEKVRPYIGD
jgi:YbgC/YbaW family acyl-CoA thioester hydrolase